jgi:hypothetical protein
MPHPRCIVDNCQNKSSPTNQHGMCFRHGDMANFLVWALPRLLVKKPQEEKEEEKKSDLWTPESGEPSGIVRMES